MEDIMETFENITRTVAAFTIVALVWALGWIVAGATVHATVILFMRGWALLS
jgi:hypothetical protein